MQSFKIVQPSPLLRRYIRHYWILQRDMADAGTERTFPLGCVQMFFHKRAQMFSQTHRKMQPQYFICGQENRYTDICANGEVEMLVVLLNRMAICSDYNIDRLSVVIRDIHLNPYLDVRKLANTACLSTKQFTRIFTEYVGASPKEFLRIVRIQRVLFLLQRNPQCNFAQVAYDGQTVGAISYAPDFKPSEHGVLIHFNCEDIDGTIRQILRQGGKMAVPKTKIQAEGKGYFAVFTDPAGNRIGLYKD